MTLALRHAIYSAILKTQATTTFMFLAGSGNLMANPYSKLLTAYLHLCCKLGTIPRGKLTYDNPQSWPSQDIALPQHTWDLQIIAVWSTAGRVHLNNQNPTWLPGLASNIPGAKWLVKNVSNDPIRDARHAVMPGIDKCEKLPLDKKQIAKVPNRPAVDRTAPVPVQSHPNLQHKVTDWKSWAYTGGSCQVQDGKTVIGPMPWVQAYTIMKEKKNYVGSKTLPTSMKERVPHWCTDLELNGAGITNTIGRAELAAIAAALTHQHTHVATDSLSSLHQLDDFKPCPYSQGHIFFNKVKSNAGIAGNEYADRIAKYQANLKEHYLTDTGIFSPDPDGNPFYNIAWLAWEKARPKIKYCKDARPGAQLEASQQQLVEHRVVTVSCAHNFKVQRSISHNTPGCRWTISTVHTLDQFHQLGIDPQRSTKLARKLHPHSVQCAQKLTSTRRADGIEIKNTHHNSGALGLHASRNPLDSH
eukprot:1161837-Pelagomonas_calceolata.AAC.12